MKKIIYLFTVVIIFGSGCCKKQAMASKESENTSTEINQNKEYEEAEKQAKLIEQMSQEKMPNEGEEYQKIAEKEIPENALARVQRTPCFGRCPIYTMIIFNDGRVEYYGKKFVEKEGRYFSKATNNQLEELTAKAQELGFFELDNIYDNKSVTDLPSTIITIKGEEGFKTVVGRYDTPKNFTTLVTFIESEFDKLEYSTPD